MILTTPGSVAQSVSDRLIKADVKGILNFTPARIDVPNDVQVHHIDLGIELQSLLFFMKTLQINIKLFLKLKCICIIAFYKYINLMETLKMVTN